MPVTVEDINSAKKILHIEVPENEVADELNKTYKKLGKTAKVKGFRPGKAPRKVLERLFKTDAYVETSSELIKSSLAEAMKRVDFTILGTPVIKPSQLDEEKPYKYDAVVEVFPKLDEIDFTGLTLKKNLRKASDDEVETQIKMLQKNMAQHETIEEYRAVRGNDIVLIDYEGFKNGKSFAETQKTQNFTLKIGDALILKEFDDQLIGMKKDETKKITVQFPKNYKNSKIANLQITFKVKLNGIRKETFPEIDDEFAKDLGDYKTLDELKSAIVKNLQEGYEKRAEHELYEQIFTALLSKNNFEAPELLVEQELAELIKEAEKMFTMHNTSMEQLGLTKEKLEEKYRDTARNQIKRHIILTKVVEQEQLTLSDEEIEEKFKEIAKQANQPVKDISDYYKHNKEKADIFRQTMLEKNAMKLMLEKSDVVQA